MVTALSWPGAFLWVTLGVSLPVWGRNAAPVMKVKCTSVRDASQLPVRIPDRHLEQVTHEVPGSACPGQSQPVLSKDALQPPEPPALQ